LFTAEASVLILRRSAAGPRALSLAADPPRPSAGRAAPDAMTSDALCRTAAPAREIHLTRPARCRARVVIPSAVLGQRGSWDPGRLRSIRCPTSLPDQASAGFAVLHSSRLPSTLFTRSEPAPCHVGQPIRVTRRGLPRLCRRKRREGKMPLTELCNRPSVRAPEEPLDSFLQARFTARRTRWRRRLTPHLQLRACCRRSRAGVPRSEERRTGAAPRCGGVLGRAQRSKLDPLTPASRSGR
jgi:hypothetical protein